jgi:hypothetical protein
MNACPSSQKDSCGPPTAGYYSAASPKANALHEQTRQPLSL